MFYVKVFRDSDNYYHPKNRIYGPFQTREAAEQWSSLCQHNQEITEDVSFPRTDISLEDAEQEYWHLAREVRNGELEKAREHENVLLKKIISTLTKESLEKYLQILKRILALDY